jgi:hypothetical protein
MILALVLVSLFPITSARPSYVSHAASVESEMRKAIAASGADVSLALRPLDGRSEILIDPDPHSTRQAP